MRLSLNKVLGIWIQEKGAGPAGPGKGRGRTGEGPGKDRGRTKGGGGSGQVRRDQTLRAVPRGSKSYKGRGV
jgi:hypothetical protein